MHYLFKDTLTSLRPKLHLFSSLEEANQAVKQMQMDLAPVLSDHVPWLYNEGSGEPEVTDSSNLGTIIEAASEGDESEVATDAETETEESMSHDGRPVKKSGKGKLYCQYKNKILIVIRGFSEKFSA